jgi:hypothetical protein
MSGAWQPPRSVVVAIIRRWFDCSSSSHVTIVVVVKAVVDVDKMPVVPLATPQAMSK